jgi:uncharacterized C2H2 Zn-finger protein
MQVTVFKCPDTGKLFEDEAAYKQHLRAVKKALSAKEKKAKLKLDCDALRTAAENATSVPELFAALNKLAALTPGYKDDRKVLEIRPELKPLIPRGDIASMQVIVFEKAGTFSSSALSNMFGVSGVQLYASTGLSMDALQSANPPRGTKKALVYQATLNLAKLPGLRAIRDKVEALNLAQDALVESNREAAHAELTASDKVYQLLQCESDQLTTDIEALTAEVTRKYNQRYEFLSESKKILDAKCDQMKASLAPIASELAELEAVITLPKSR